MIPMTKEQAESIANKRHGTTKICCVFCERRIGWFDSISIGSLLKEYGLSICDDCKSSYSRWLYVENNSRYDR